jgi:starch phosphorylase
VQLVIAGKAHPADSEGQELIRQWFQFSQRSEVQNHVIFISDYDILVAEQLVSGADVWINNPRRPWEASGTSGMKVLVNGGLNLSELDGWWAEAYTPDVGWALGDGQEHDSDASWDEHEALQMYDLLENQIVREFYDRNEHDIPEKWVARMRESMSRLTPYYSTNRMVQQYLNDYYIPCARKYKERSHAQGKLGTALESWRHELKQCWTTMYIGATQIENQENSRIFKIPVNLGEVKPEMVNVELFAEALQQHESPECIRMHQDHELVGTSNEFLYTAIVPGNRSPEDYTARIIPAHQHASVPMELANILWQK